MFRLPLNPFYQSYPLLVDGAPFFFAGSEGGVEGIHYLPATPPRAVGWKAMARNLSDIAAMGGRPRWAVVSIGLRPATPVRWVKELYASLHAAARKFGCEIVGGDTTHVRHEQFVVVTMLGEAERPSGRSSTDPAESCTGARRVPLRTRRR